MNLATCLRFTLRRRPKIAIKFGLILPFWWFCKKWDKRKNDGPKLGTFSTSSSAHSMEKLEFYSHLRRLFSSNQLTSWFINKHVDFTEFSLKNKCSGVKFSNFPHCDGWLSFLLTELFNTRTYQILYCTGWGVHNFTLSVLKM